MFAWFMKTSNMHEHFALKQFLKKKIVFKGVIVRSNPSYPDGRASELPPTISRPSRSTSLGYPISISVDHLLFGHPSQNASSDGRFNLTRT